MDCSVDLYMNSTGIGSDMIKDITGKCILSAYNYNEHAWDVYLHKIMN